MDQVLSTAKNRHFQIGQKKFRELFYNNTGVPQGIVFGSSTV